MRCINLMSRITTASLAVLAAAFVVSGCGKKAAEAPASTASNPADTGVTATAAAEPAQPSGPAVVVDNVNVADTKAAMSAAAAALKAKQYEDATKLILALQAQRLSDQQAAALHNQMVQLQRNVANGVANGDPNAQAAAEMLRASALHR